MNVLKNPQVRKWLYSVGVAICALLAVYGVLNETHLNAWNVLLAALFGLSIYNVPTKENNEH